MSVAGSKIDVTEAGVSTSAIGKSRNIPGPRGYPLVGILPHLRKNPLQYFVKVAREYGDVVRLDFGPKKFYLLNHPAYIKYVLHDNHANFRKGYDLVKPVLGDGLITSEGALWRRQRRLLQPAFHRRQLEGLVSLMVKNIARTLQGWDTFAARSAAFDMEEEMFRLTRYNLVKTMFNLDLETKMAEVGKDFEACLAYLQQLMKAPFKPMAYLPTPTNVRFWRARKRLDRLVYDILAKRRSNGGGASDDLLALLLKARDDETHDNMSDRQLRDEVMTLLIAGHETTATALTWTWYLLAKHPEVAGKVTDEIRTVLSGRTPTFEDVPKLVFTGMVIDEVLRLYPSTWLFARQAIASFEIGSYAIPKSAMIFMSPFIMHRHPTYWSGPEAFQPERFLPDKKAQQAPYTYFPFGGGPRSCIGDQFALTVMKLVVAMVLQRYRLTVAEDRIIEPLPKATLRPGSRLQMMVNFL